MGTLVQSGNYLNVTIPGVEGKDGSIAYPAEDYSAFYNKEVKVTGFYLGGQTHYSTMVVKLEATGGSGGGGDNPPAETSLAKIIKAENNADVETDEVLVVAKYARGVMLQEGDDHLLVYDVNGVNAQIGDKVTVSGKKATYSGQAQITTPTVTVKSSGNTVTYPTVKVLDASNFASFSSNVPVYIQYKGTLVQSGNYLNVTIAGVEGKDGSIAYPAEDYSAFYNKDVTVTGFYLGGQTHYSTMVVKLVAADGTGGDTGGGTGGDTGTGQTFSTIAGLANDADVETNEVLVVGKHARGVMLQEGTAYMLAFDANGVNANVGDKVVVTGKKGTYSGMAQIASPSVTVKSTGNTVTYPTPKVLDATNFATYTATAPEYIQYTGKLVKSGNVEGKDGSIAYPIGSYDEFVDKNVTVSGFFVGGSTHYNTMAITVVEAGGSTGGDTGGSTGGDTGGGTGGDSGDSYASTLTWTLGANASDAKVKVNGSATETAALKLGTSSKAGTATLTVPAGASKISFYGLGWKGKTATLTVKLTGMTDKQAECTANDGVSNNSPFTVTVAGTDKKTIDVLFSLALYLNETARLYSSVSGADVLRRREQRSRRRGSPLVRQDQSGFQCQGKPVCDGDGVGLLDAFFLGCLGDGQSHVRFRLHVQRGPELECQFGGRFPGSDGGPDSERGRNVKGTPGWMEMPEIPASHDGYGVYTHDMTIGSTHIRNYSFYWDYQNLVAWWVAYPLNAWLVGTGSRSDQWGLDPLLAEKYQPVLYNGFKGGPYDRGHQLPSADRLHYSANVATFYFTNMTPQLSAFNQNIWANFENRVRSWGNGSDTLYVVTGCVPGKSTTKATDNEGKSVTVPEGYFKAVLRYKANSTFGFSDYAGCAVYLDHRSYSETTVNKEMSMSIADLEKKLGYQFFVNLPAKVGAETATKIKSQDPKTVAWWWQ